jgi:hypothetical protein
MDDGVSSVRGSKYRRLIEQVPATRFTATRFDDFITGSISCESDNGMSAIPEFRDKSSTEYTS